MNKTAVFSLLYAFLTGCSSLPSGINSHTQSSMVDTGSPPSASTNYTCGFAANGTDIKLSLALEALNENRPHAAIAHLDSIEEAEIPDGLGLYLRAEALRKSGRLDAASRVYTSLINGCMDGAGHHGLGLIAAEQGNYAAAIEHLVAARNSLPTDPKVRNDYGYALLLSKHFPEARREFITALELDKNNIKASHNLILALLLMSEEDKADKLARSLELSRSQFEQLRLHAQKLASRSRQETPND